MRVNCDPDRLECFDYDGHICGVLLITASYLELQTNQMKFPQIACLASSSQSTHQSEEA